MLFTYYSPVSGFNVVADWAIFMAIPLNCYRAEQSEKLCQCVDDQHACRFTKLIVNNPSEFGTFLFVACKKKFKKSLMNQLFLAIENGENGTIAYFS